MDRYARVVSSVEGSSLRSGRSRSARWRTDSSEAIDAFAQWMVHGGGRLGGGDRWGERWLGVSVQHASRWKPSTPAVGVGETCIRHRPDAALERAAAAYIRRRQ